MHALLIFCCAEEDLIYLPFEESHWVFSRWENSRNFENAWETKQDTVDLKKMKPDDHLGHKFFVEMFCSGYKYDRDFNFY